MITLGVSSCLLGIDCNFSGSHNRDTFVSKELAKFVEYTPFCPEVLLLGAPRESIRLIRGEDKKIRVIGNKTKNDYTESLNQISIQFLEDESFKNLSGYILKSKSPSCGMERVKLYNHHGLPEFETTTGLFAKILKERFPLLPLEEEGRLEDAWLRENFVMQIFAYSDWMESSKDKKSSVLVEFHTKYKFLLQSKDEDIYRKCGNVVANIKQNGIEESFAEYDTLFKLAISKKTRIKPVINVLHHILGFLKNNLEKGEKAHILEMVEGFRQRILPLVAILELLKIYIQKYDVTYLKNQAFLSPYPKELALRSDLKAYK